MDISLDTSSWNAPNLPVGNSPVTPLDSPLVKQTKSEIRAIAAEIAQLAHSNVDFDEFLDGFLSRLTSAMGATGAAVWSWPPESVSAQAPATKAPSNAGETGSLRIRWLAHYQLPPSLLSDAARDSDAGEQSVGCASESHAEILRCIAREGQPILVPPSSVTIDADRPTNPSDQALVVVPVRLEDSVEFLIEVAQTASGGPASQRGYLRFVAQMADLFADYVRRNRLRQSERKIKRTRLRESWVLRCVQSVTRDDRWRSAADAMRDVANASQAIVFEVAQQRGSSSPRLVGTPFVSGVENCDPRSELVPLLRAFLKDAGASKESLNSASSDNMSGWYSAAERRTAEDSVGKTTSVLLPNSVRQFPDSMAEQLQSRHFCFGRLCQNPELRILLGFSDSQVRELAKSQECPRLSHDHFDDDLVRIGAAVQESSATGRSLQSWWRAASFGQVLRAPGVFKLVGAAMFLAACLLPVPQRISVDAVLQPVNRTAYYAPARAIVRKVHCGDGEWVQEQQPLLRLQSFEIENEIDRLQGQWNIENELIEEKGNLLDYSGDLPLRERDDIEGSKKRHEIQRASFDAQLKRVKAIQDELELTCREAGEVATWDSAYRLLNRWVEKDDLLATTYDPNGPWQLVLSIPDHRVGLVNEAMEAAGGALPLKFALRSQPEHVVSGSLSHLDVVAIPDASDPSRRIVRAAASFDAVEIRLKKDGSIAQATIECGSVPLLWLITRDAYIAVQSRIKLYW